MELKYLYKFVSLGDASSMKTKMRLASLSRNQIWFSRPEILNDPYEFRGLYVDYEQMKKAGISIEEVNDLQKMLENEYVLSSFTLAMEDNFPMWAHYANEHKGFCVKYKVEENAPVKKVFYVKQRMDATESIQRAIHMNAKIKERTVDSEIRIVLMGLQDMFMRVLEQNYTMKHESWKYEDKYRIIMKRTDEENPFGQNVFAQDVGLSLDSIYIGYACEVPDQIKEIAAGLGASCKQCVLNDKNYLIFTE